MFGIFIKHHLIFIIFLNIIENLLHFTNGQNQSQKRVIGLKLLYLQGGITEFFIISINIYFSVYITSSLLSTVLLNDLFCITI
jgi:hypothetical protein